MHGGTTIKIIAVIFLTYYSMRINYTKQNKQFLKKLKIYQVL
jgi:hypothetical protein